MRVFPIMSFRHCSRLLILFLACLCLGNLALAQAPGPTTPAASPAPALQAEPVDRMDLLDDARKIQNFDRVLFRVVEDRDPPMLLLVDDRGEVTIPLLGAVPARGLTCRKLARDLKQRLEVDFFHQATVLVEFQFADNTRGKVNLVGRVARPGPLPIPLDEVLTVSAAVIRGGGLLPGANRREVQVLRADPANPEKVDKLVVDLEDILDKGNLAADVLVRADDTILVPENAGAGGTFYVTGAVGAPGEYPFPEGAREFTVSQAILRAGGFAKFADKDAVIVIRNNPANPGKPERLKVNVREVLEEGLRQQDLPLKRDDIVRVRELWFTIQ